MKTLDIKAAVGTLATYARDMSAEPVIITDGDKPVAALISMRDTDMETARLSTDPRFAELIQRSRARHAAEGGISSRELRRRLGAPGPAAKRPRNKGRRKPNQQ